MNITDHSNFVKEQKALSAIINVFSFERHFSLPPAKTPSRSPKLSGGRKVLIT